VIDLLSGLLLPLFQPLVRTSKVFPSGLSTVFTAWAASALPSSRNPVEGLEWQIPVQPSASKLVQLEESTRYRSSRLAAWCDHCPIAPRIDSAPRRIALLSKEADILPKCTSKVSKTRVNKQASPVL